MTLEIRAVREKGVLDKERIVLAADANEDIGQYVLFSTRSTGDNKVSSRVRRTLWLPDYQVEAGDLVVVSYPLASAPIGLGCFCSPWPFSPR